MRSLARLIGALTLLMALGGAAHAQTSPKAAAETLFQAGRTHMERGELAEACKKFEASQAIDDALGTRLHLADCYERSGRTASAWAAFEAAASLAQATGQDRREKVARARAKALEPKLARLELHVADQHLEGYELKVSGALIPRSSWNVSLPVDPGEQVVEASAPGYITWTRAIRFVDDGHHEVVPVPPLEKKRAARVRPRPAPAPAAPLELPDAGDADRGNAQRASGIAIGAIGIAGLVAGGVLGIRAILKNDESFEHCRPEDETACTPEGAALREEAHDHALASTIAFAAGGGLFGLGIVLFATAPRAETGRVVVRARSARTGGAISLGGVW